jgi:non-ribosomal peptide synthetase component F
MLLDAFLGQCQMRPDAVALEEEGLRIGYGELLARANAIAAALQALGIVPGQRVAIHLERGIHAVAAVFGTLLAGACPVPLDLKNPPTRLAFIVDDAQVSAVAGKGGQPHWLAGCHWLDVPACPPSQPRPVVVEAQALAAILYTSGSSGQPKGVALSHAAVAAFAEWAADLLELGVADRIASSAPFFFDLSTFDLYAVLGRGASLHFVPGPLALAPARLSAWLSGQAITGWYTVPSLLAFLAYKGNLPHTPLPDLRFLVFAGEVFPAPALASLAESLPATALYNFFGPTETNVCCHWPVDRERLDPSQPVPIGLPAAGDELHIDAASGELWVRGPTLACGYWSRGRLQGILN